jgi:hypothetical protein
MLQNSENGVDAPRSGDTRAIKVDQKANRTLSFRSVTSDSESRSVTSDSEVRLNDRLARTLSQKRGQNTVIVGALFAALLLGLVGLALHFLWIVAILVIALGLGYTIANSRLDRIDVVNRRAQERSATRSSPTHP